MRALRLLVWVAVLAGLVAAVWARPSFPTVGDDRHVTCDAPTHYACGRQIGAKQRARVKAAIFSPHTKVLVAWAQTVEGNATLSTYLAMHSRELPELLDEVRGIADGAGVPFYPDLFALNMDVEISSKFLGGSLAPLDRRQKASRFLLELTWASFARSLLLLLVYFRCSVVDIVRHLVGDYCNPF